MNMDFMNKFSKAINKASEKAGELTQQAKLKVDEQKLKGQISTKYKQLGEKIYFTKKENFSTDELLSAIDQHVEEIDLLMDALSQLAVEQAALVAEKEVVADEEVEEESLELNHCTNCGVVLNDEAVFCPACGTKQE
jgi:hypothetical protein